MLFETLSSAEAIGYSSMRMIECPGLDKSSADMHLGPSRAHLTLDSTPGQTRFLRRLDFSNSLLVSKVDKIVSQEEDEDKSLNFDAAVENSKQGEPAQQKLTALQRCRGLFETDPVRAPTQIVEAVLRPSCLSLDELDGTNPFPTENLIKLSALFNVCFMSRQTLIQYLITRAALFLPVNDEDNNNEDAATSSSEQDYFVRLLDPTLLREGVLEISSFLSTLEEYYNDEVSGEEEEEDQEENEQLPEDAELSEEEKTKKAAERAAEKEKKKNEEKHLNSNILTEKVRDHFSSAQFPIVYEVAWQYMTSLFNIENPNQKYQQQTFNLPRIVPLLATHLVSKPGALTKQSLSELWEGCVAEYWFLNEKYYSPIKTSTNPNPAIIWSGEAHLYGYFAKTELKGVVVAPHSRMPLQLVPRIIHLFKMSSKWEKAELMAFLNPIAESTKILNTTFGRRCRQVKDGKNTWCYLI